MVRGRTPDLAVLDRCEGAVPTSVAAGAAGGGTAARGRTVLAMALVPSAARLPVPQPPVSSRCRREGAGTVPPGGSGNIGIGGDPRALLDRLGLLRALGGLLIAETAVADVDELAEVQVVDGTGRRSGTRRGGRRRGVPVACAAGTPALLWYALAGRGWRTAVSGRRAPSGRLCWGRAGVRAGAPGQQQRRKPPNSTALISSQRARKPSVDKPVADR